MAQLRTMALVFGLSLLGSFITVMTVHYLLPFDPFDPEPLINYRVLFVIVFFVIWGAVSIARVYASRES